MRFDKIREFRESHSTLCDTSYDKTNDVRLSESSGPVYNFDKVKALYFRLPKESDCPAKSADALLVKNGINIFIEFKNEKVESNEIRMKISDSLLVFNDLTDSQLHERKYDSDFILVYDAGKNPSVQSRTIIANRVMELAGAGEIIRFGLEKYAGIFFRELHTYNKDEFKEYLISQGLLSS